MDEPGFVGGAPRPGSDPYCDLAGPPLPATGAEMRESAVVIYRIADDRIAEHSFDQG